MKSPIFNRSGFSVVQLIVISITVTVIIRVVAIVAGQAGRTVQGSCVAVTTRRTAMIDTTPSFIRDARMRTVIFCKPILRGMTRDAIETEHSSMVHRVTVTTRACG
jgi:hypothetical protein